MYTIYNYVLFFTAFERKVLYLLESMNYEIKAVLRRKVDKLQESVTSRGGDALEPASTKTRKLYSVD